MSSSSSIYECIIIGGGASGLYCASLLANNGVNNVCVVDSNSRVGKKLMLTGSGRCNITNTCINMSAYNSDDNQKVFNIIESHNSKDVIEYFQNVLGVDVCYKDNLVYPNTLSSSTVVDALRYHINENGVDVLTDSKCVRVVCTESGYDVVLENKSVVKGRKIVFASGGITYAQTGCSTLGLGLVSLVSKAKIAPLLPSLVSLTSSDKDIKSLSGSKIACKVRLFDSGDNELRCSEGELLFTDKGVSGICVMDISGFAVNAMLREGKKVYVSLDMSELSEKELAEAFMKRIALFPERDAISAFEGMYRRTMLEVIFKRCSIKASKAGDLSDKDINKIVSCFKNFKVSINGSGEADKGQVTRGGVMLDQVNDNLMLNDANNAYVIGEMLNVDGICGGYNLQWAWSSAYAASKSIIEDCANV